MSGSPAFARIRGEVLAVTRAIPRGRVATYPDIGAFLDVMPRHVAYLLGQLTPEERTGLPWHRVVGRDGALARPRADFHGRTQGELLAAEGVTLDPKGRVAELARRRWVPDRAATGVTPTPHPARGSRAR